MLCGITLQGKQVGKKIKSGIQFFALHLSASPKTTPELGK
jgi:hypothetical protein